MPSLTDLKLEHVKVDVLLAHPQNYRIHPEDQVEQLAASLFEHGFQKPVVVNADGKTLLAGHGLVMAASRWWLWSTVVGWKTELTEEERTAQVQAGIWESRVTEQGLEIRWARVPVKRYDGPNALRFLVADNRTAQLAQDDVMQLFELTDDLGPLMGTGLTPEFMTDLESAVWALQQQEAETMGAALTQDALQLPVKLPVFPSTNEWDVPDLLVELQARELTPPVVKWGIIRRTDAMPGTYHMYTDDYKFNSLVNEPYKPIQAGCAAIIEVNFSTGPESRRSLVLADIYWKRWLSRFWQDAGIQIWVDLCVEHQFADLTLLGVPKEWRAFATRGYARRSEDMVLDWELARKHVGTDEFTFLVYGGSKAAAKLCDERGWLHVIEHMAAQTQAKQETTEPEL